MYSTRICVWSRPEKADRTADDQLISQEIYEKSQTIMHFFISLLMAPRQVLRSPCSRSLVKGSTLLGNERER